MSVCLLLGVVALALPGADLTLRWTHSVEKTDWVEQWHIEGPHLHLVGAAVKGSGAGMDPAPDARLDSGWWVWNPDVRLDQITLAASGATGAGWTLCSQAQCHDIGATPGAALTLRPCKD